MATYMLGKTIVSCKGGERLILVRKKIDIYVELCCREGGCMWTFIGRRTKEEVGYGITHAIA